MRLMEALKAGRICGLKTVGEAVDNVTIHAMNLFKYEDIDAEMLELTRECEHADFNKSIVSVLGEKRCKSIDAEVAHDLT